MAKDKTSKPKKADKAVKKISPATKKPLKPEALAKITKTYTKLELLNTLAKRSNLDKKTIALFLDGLIEVILAHLKKGSIGKFILPGILKINLKSVAAKPERMGKNPFTGEEIMLKAKPASKKVKITALQKLKAAV